jgi:hypothetical protein
MLPFLFLGPTKARAKSWPPKPWCPAHFDESMTFPQVQELRFDHLCSRRLTANQAESEVFRRSSAIQCAGCGDPVPNPHFQAFQWVPKTCDLTPRITVGRRRTEIYSYRDTTWFCSGPKLNNVRRTCVFIAGPEKPVECLKCPLPQRATQLAGAGDLGYCLRSPFRQTSEQYIAASTPLEGITLNPAVALTA